MARDLHTVAVIDGSTLSREDRLILALLPQQAHAIGSGAGVAQTIVVTGLNLPAVYGVQAVPSQDATVWITARTQAGFTVNIAPRLAATTLAVGTVDIMVFA